METMIHKNVKKSFDFINEQVNKKSINKLLAQIYLEFGGAKTAQLADNLKNQFGNFQFTFHTASSLV